MGDVFKEQLVAMKKTSKDQIQGIGIWVAVVIVAVMSISFLGTIFGGVLTVAAGWGALYFSATLKKEFEYTITNNELDIDVIYNQERRKRLMTVDLKKIELMVSIQDDKHKDSLERAQKIIDASNGEYTQDTYGLLLGHEGQLTKILVTPNEDMLHLIYRQAPHKVIKNR